MRKNIESLEPRRLLAVTIGNETAQAIAVDGHGNLYITGHTQSPGRATPGAFDTSYNGGDDAYLQKLNRFGKLIFFTYLGGSGRDNGLGVAVDSVGNAYVTGLTTSIGLQKNGAAYHGGDDDAFVAKISSDGTALIYYTYIGGTATESGNDIVVDSVGSAFIVGSTTSTGLATADALDGAYGGNIDGFFAQISTDGSSVPYFSYVGSANRDTVNAIARDTSGNFFVAGTMTRSTDDAFVTKLTANGHQLGWTGFIAGSDGDFGYDVAVDPAGNAYLTGSTYSSGIATAGAFDTTADTGGNLPAGDAFVAKFNGTSGSIVYSTYYEGAGNDEGHGIAVNGNGEAIVTGTLGVSGLTNNAQYQHNGFVVKFNSAGNTLLYEYKGITTNITDNEEESVNAVAIDSASNAFVCGEDYNATTNSQGTFLRIHAFNPAPARGASNIGTFSGGKFTLDANGNHALAGDDPIVNTGLAVGQPLAGDWNGDGITDLGLRIGNTFYLDFNGNKKWDGNAGGDQQFAFGLAGDKAVIGDWNHDGADEVGIFRNGSFWLDKNGDHIAGANDLAFNFGQPGDIPVAGDWNGDGFYDIGVRRGDEFLLDSDASHGFNAGDLDIHFGAAGDGVVIGDWNNDGKSDIGVKRGSTFYLDSDGSHSWTPGVDLAFSYGLADDKAIAGIWI